MVDVERHTVGDAVGAFVGVAVIVVNAKGRAVGGAVGAFVRAAVKIVRASCSARVFKLVSI